MASTDEGLLTGVRAGRQRLTMTLTGLLVVPGVALRLAGRAGDLPHPLAALLFGVAIVGAAFFLAWAGEVAQLDVSAGLAIATLAFVAVLPEYAVGLIFAAKGGHDFHRYGAACRSAAQAAAHLEPTCSLALANMTGAIRLLIGVGWSMVVFVGWWQWRKRGRRRHATIELERSHAVELSYLAVATGYSLTLPLKRSITLVDAAVLIAVFLAYTVRVSRAPADPPHLVGPSRWLGTFANRPRRTIVAGLFVVAAAVILLCAEPFADALVDTGKSFHVSEFLLVQWLAPIASEAPELLVAGLFAYRLNTSTGLSTLVSSKVNQWTLLIGTLPVVFAVSSQGLHGLPIAATARGEVLLTAAQSVFAVAILVDLRLTALQAASLFGLFWAQFAIGAFVPSSAHGVERIVVSVLYLVLGAGMLVRSRDRIGPVLRDGFRTSYDKLMEGP